MVDMHMTDHQGLNTGDIEVDGQAPGTRAATRGFRALEQTTVHQQAGSTAEAQLVAGASNTIDGPVV